MRFLMRYLMSNNYVKGSSFQILLVSLRQASKYCNK